ncbi:MAG: ferredoxin [Pseudonocardiaceae bacterium]
MRMIVDTDVCTGHGVCEGIRPDVFEVGDDGITHLLTEDLTEQDRHDLEDAVDQCPTQALRLEE